MECDDLRTKEKTWALEKGRLEERLNVSVAEKQFLITQADSVRDELEELRRKVSHHKHAMTSYSSDFNIFNQ